MAAFDETQVRAPAVAFNLYGKGIKPRARLNLPECAAYALAKTMNAPLLFEGDDFAQTDLQPLVRKMNVPTGHPLILNPAIRN